jgi:hypothetical protein
MQRMKGCSECSGDRGGAPETVKHPLLLLLLLKQLSQKMMLVG